MVNLYSTIEKEMIQHEISSGNEIALKNTLSVLNAKYILSGNTEFIHQNTTAVKKLNIKKWLPYAMAASIIIAAALFFLIKPSVHGLAEDYIAQNLATLSLTMAGSNTDTLQAGISAYNNKEYQKAQLLFTRYSTNHPESSDAKKYEGLAFLSLGQYDAALDSFDKLANMQGLFSNPGNFLEAVTLMKRNTEGDKEQAKQLLEKVVKEKTEGSDQAEEWLGKM
jgi:tetratricopeptide (TPR) repeat protein